MPATFEGFSQKEEVFMRAAYVKLQRASMLASQSFLGGDLAAYNKWFDGTGKNAQLMKVATNVKGINDAILGRPLTIAKLDRPGVNVDTKGLCAYVFLVQSGQFAHHVGSGMRILVVWKTHAGSDLGYLAQTMYHELAHKVGGVDDLNYNEAVCQQYARTAPQNAANNAENYNLFLGEFL
jgi:predicted aminopeptidase